MAIQTVLTIYLGVDDESVLLLHRLKKAATLEQTTVSALVRQAIREKIDKIVPKKP